MAEMNSNIEPAAINLRQNDVASIFEINGDFYNMKWAGSILYLYHSRQLVYPAPQYNYGMMTAIAYNNPGYKIRTFDKDVAGNYYRTYTEDFIYNSSQVYNGVENIYHPS